MPYLKCVATPDFKKYSRRSTKVQQHQAKETHNRGGQCEGTELYHVVPSNKISMG